MTQFPSDDHLLGLRGKYVVFALEIEGGEAPRSALWRAWLWGNSPKMLYLCEGPAKACVWMVPREVVCEILPANGHPDVEHIMRSPWFGAFELLYRVLAPDDRQQIEKSRSAQKRARIERR